MPDASQVTLKLLPHADLQCLVLEPAQLDGPQHLCHRLSGERVALPPSHSPWEMDWADGFAYVENGEDTMWAQSLLSMGMYEIENDPHHR